MTRTSRQDTTLAETAISSTEEIVEEIRNGRMIALVDDEDRENEGDLIIAAQFATPEAINFMAQFGRGLICLCLTAERIAQLELEPMSRENGTRHQTAFTTSIDARFGRESAISAAGRAYTVAVAINVGNDPDQLDTPGHVFPLRARDGGVLVRAGHTEAAVDLAKLASLNPSAVICEVMNDDGSMARLADLLDFSRRHNLKIGTIRDLILYRRLHDRIVKRVAEGWLETRLYGRWKVVEFENRIDGSRYLALVKGAIEPATPTLVRMHVPDILADACGAEGTGAGVIAASMEAIAEAGRGVIGLIPASYDPATTVRWGAQSVDQRDEVLRDYGIGAQILADLGVSDMVLLTNSHPQPVGLSAYGLRIVAEQPIDAAS